MDITEVAASITRPELEQAVEQCKLRLANEETILARLTALLGGVDGAAPKRKRGRPRKPKTE